MAVGSSVAEDMVNWLEADDNLKQVRRVRGGLDLGLKLARWWDGCLEHSVIILTAFLFSDICVLDTVTRIMLIRD